MGKTTSLREVLVYTKADEEVKFDLHPNERIIVQEVRPVHTNELRWHLVIEKTEES
jgi:hypothetical protein